ncbi:MAG: hypothetical protein A2428_09300 [Bdellovibrionales bacterium RIFOXYC1_FULL_54_43]|nr:MAG: hypothetical protein A2428_09300 [Bdellovibrionales bacterium RIFOXYC1_FULL_54_43]OFZ80884.1 MAG: hypothetical protein A2603_08190 [Bdellovibrionales bacterium RIFOXYD1_FULL_55_31]
MTRLDDLRALPALRYSRGTRTSCARHFIFAFGKGSSNQPSPLSRLGVVLIPCIPTLPLQTRFAGSSACVLGTPSRNQPRK